MGSNHSNADRLGEVKSPKTPPLSIRPMMVDDLEAVMEIDRNSFLYPLGKEDFVHALKRRDCKTLVVTAPDHRSGQQNVFGYVIWSLTLVQMEVHRLTVNPFFQFHGIGSWMVNSIKKAASKQNVAVVMDVRETDSRSQRFLASHGFRATQVKRRHFTDSGEDAYHFEFRFLAE
jgi:[ribosomal protein S18]-alanine N-acetyltransferase